jgi:hypothetical protein
VWGVQLGHLNTQPVEYPNWSDSPVGGFVNINNRPWGLMTFSGAPVLFRSELEPVLFPEWE